MRRHFIILTAFTIAALLFAGCNKEQDNTGTGERVDWDGARYLTGFSMAVEEVEQWLSVLSPRSHRSKHRR